MTFIVKFSTHVTKSNFLFFFIVEINAKTKVKKNSKSTIISAIQRKSPLPHQRNKGDMNALALADTRCHGN